MDCFADDTGLKWMPWMELQAYIQLAMQVMVRFEANMQKLLYELEGKKKS